MKILVDIACTYFNIKFLESYLTLTLPHTILSGSVLYLLKGAYIAKRKLRALQNMGNPLIVVPKAACPQSIASLLYTRIYET